MLQQRGLLPGQHLVDGGYTSVALLDAAARDHQVEPAGPLKADGPWQRKDKTGFAREDSRHRLQAPPGDLPSRQDHGELGRGPGNGALSRRRFNDRHCGPCKVRSSCTRGTSARTISFLPQHLHDLQVRHRPAQETPEWKRLYGARPGIGGTVNECVNGHRMRRCRYHGLDQRRRGGWRLTS